MIDKFKEKFQTIINKNWFNIPVEEDDKQKKIVKFNIYILTGAGTIIIIFLFYLILSLSTNFSKLDDFEDYIDEYKEKEYPTKFSEINLGIKIKPSYNLENNILYMRHSSDVSIKNNYFFKFKYSLINR